MAIGRITININGCKINSMENGSVVSLKGTVQKRKTNSYKESFGYGYQNGDGVFIHGEASAILDQDIVDSIRRKGSL
ncbi:hypothetical protein DRW41_01495 [Neobacillus piezotolerans]|uniref:Uncharacterized protein n=1 Tax=Neobacillus piezotolerans TaxID=2259171 RepID=A0A3D8GVT0_9BACI|nr:hypothetical protein [Neobacillus piezotolerans]RDU38271.1 hypothetical protein DRW41_01495 [Neobacillus piezotolerans]